MIAADLSIRPRSRSRARRRGVAGLAAALLLAAVGIAGAEDAAVVPAAEDAPALPPQSSATAPATPEDALLAASIEDRPYDPMEPINRVFFGLNRGIDFILLDPVSKAYGFLLPDFAKRAVRRMFDNLDSPSTLVNDLLQLELRDAGITTLRFAINSTLGLGGLLDPMAESGFPGHHSDFGQTLWRIGVGPGPYFVIPALGPTNARDGIGDFVDSFFRVQSWVLGPGGRLLVSTTDGITLREANLAGIEALRDASVDYYSAMRGAYLMNREGELRREAERRAERCREDAGTSPSAEASAP